jgi:iron complex transport system substrate-binding protein
MPDIRPSSRARVVALLALPLLACGNPAATKNEPRLVAIGAAVTETLFALGVGKDVVAVDRTSIFPMEAAALPKVGLPGQLSVEGIAAQRPTLIIADAPPAALALLESAGLAVARLAEAPSTVEGAAARIEAIGALVDRAAAAKTLVASLRADVAAVEAIVAKQTTRPRALFVYARGPRTLLIAGSDTPAEAVLRMAGADNAVTGFSGMKPLSAEVVLAARPEVIVIPTRGLDSLGGEDGLLAIPGIAETPAAKNRKVIAVDDGALLAFGPRLPEGLRALAHGLHPDLSPTAPHPTQPTQPTQQTQP